MTDIAMTDRRVVITGLGVLTPVGNEVETFWSNLKNGVSGIHTIDGKSTDVLPGELPPLGIGATAPRVKF